MIGSESNRPGKDQSGQVDHDLPPFAGEIVFYQTAAGEAYEAMLAATAPLHRAYCAANRCDYATFLGVRRGFHAWQSIYNRIEQLADLVAAGFDGWFVYLDADAVICQPGFDLRRYLGKRAGCAFIAAPGGSEWWNVNDGIFFLNLGHPRGPELVRRWQASFRNVTEAMLEAAVAPWQPLPDGSPFPDDQHLLQMELLRGGFADVTLIERSGLLNYGGGRFIRQFMRVGGSAEDRLVAIRAAVHDVY